MYTEIDSNGFLVHIHVTDNPGTYTPGTGNRLVLDPWPAVDTYDSFNKKPVRILPVPADASTIEYTFEYVRTHEEQCIVIRNMRNLKLMKCDWVVLEDSYIKNNKPEIYQQWVEYRQALRDINLISGFPYEFEWPQEPEGGPKQLILGSLVI